MTAQKLFGTLKFIDSLDGTLELQSTLEAIHSALSSLASAPAQPQYQIALAAALKKFSESAKQLGTLITPSQMASIAEMGGEEFFASNIADRVQESVSANAMTPSVAKDFVAGLAGKRATFLNTVRNAIEGLQELGIKAPAVAAGTADIAFLVPRDLFENHLHEFSKELKFIDKLTGDFTEAITGSRQPVELEELSSSVPTIALAVGIVVVDKLATIVNKFLDAWKKLEEIRDIRSRLKKVGMAGGSTETELSAQITTTVNEVVEESTEVVMIGYTGTDEGRKNELRTAITQDTKRLFGQIERGLMIEFRASPGGAKNEQDRVALENIANMGGTMQFPPVPPEPLLLSGGEVLEGEIEGVAVIKKTVKTTKKETQLKETKPEVKVD